MDALGAYGSDSSADDSSKAANDEAKKKPAAANPMSALLGLPDGSSSSEDDEATTKEPASKKLKTGGDDQKAAAPATDDTTTKATQPIQLLPPPTLSTESRFYWPENFLKLNDTHFIRPNNITDDMIATRERLEAMRKQGTTTYADQLKSQQDFHNPHLFAKIVQEVGLRNPLASHLSSQILEDWEYELVGTTPPSQDNKNQRDPNKAKEDEEEEEDALKAEE
jgi:hypothetical protein